MSHEPAGGALVGVNAGAARPGRLAQWLYGTESYVWLIPGLVLMGMLFVIPIAHIALTSFTNPTFGLQNYARIADDPLYVRVLANTGISAVGATLACLLLGYPTAYVIYRAPPRWKKLLLGAVLFSYAVGTMPRAFSWLVVLGDRGLINRALMTALDFKQPVHLIYNLTGVLVGMTHVMLPFMTLTLLGSMARVPPPLVPAARTLGAGPMRAFLSVFLPLTLPGIIAGAMMTFVYSLGFYVVPAVLGGAGQTSVVMSIRDLALSLGLWGLASALAVVMLLISTIGAIVYVRATKLADSGQHN